MTEPDARSTPNSDEEQELSRFKPTRDYGSGLQWIGWRLLVGAAVAIGLAYVLFG